MDTGAAFDLGSVVAHIKADLTSFKQGIAEVKTGTTAMKTSIGEVSAAASSMAGIFGIALGAAGVVGLIKKSIDAFEEQQRVLAQTNAVIASTGGAAGISANQIHDMAEEIQRTTPISNDAAQSGMNMLLTFTQLGKENFPQATRAVIDMATAMNGGLTPSAQQLTDTAIQIGKAMNDPILGMTTLRRVGVEFTDQQKQQIQTMLEANNQMGAQKLILDELSKEFGGSATAQAQTFGGQMQMLSNNFQDMMKTVGGALAPAIEYLGQAFSGAGQGGGILIGVVKALASVMVSAVMIAQLLGQAISTALAAGYAAMTGNFAQVGRVLQVGGKDMGDTLVKTSNTMNRIWAAGTAQQVSTTANGVKQMANLHDQGATQMANDLKKETQEFENQNLKRQQSFTDSLASMVRAHQDKVKQIQSQLADENRSYQNTLSDRTQTFSEQMQDLKDSHEDKVKTVQEQIDAETAKGQEADESRLALLQKQLTDENKVYDTQVTKDNTRHDEEMARLKRDHDEKVSATQTELNTEQAILQRHADDVKAVQDKANMDDIQSLHAKFDMENKDAEEQHQQRMKDIASQGSSQGGAYGGGINSGLAAMSPKIANTMQNIGQNAATKFIDSMADGANKAASKFVSNFINGLADNIKNAAGKLATAGANMATGGLFGVVSDAYNAIKGLPHFDSGGVISGAIGSPQLVVAHGGETILPTHKANYNEMLEQMQKTGNNKTVNQYVYATMNDKVDVDSLTAQLAAKMRNSL